MIMSYKADVSFTNITFIVFFRFLYRVQCWCLKLNKGMNKAYGTLILDGDLVMLFHPCFSDDEVAFVFSM